MKIVIDAGMATGDAETIEELVGTIAAEYERQVVVWQGFLKILDEVDNDNLVPAIQRLCQRRFNILRDNGFKVQFSSPDLAHKHIH